ncbi:phosphate/phosphite/phosphonate ABC transporter substrate-binding protein [Pseudomonas sp. nanlin1]|uniref:phosphate/phosphite/phosphonate ABC transporter substrate-binding protein n=1 Tax=Pseudomonas sp. nanlin1 TaxID=3040605 RepID=UPI0038900448
MYTAPDAIEQASSQWLALTAQLLGVEVAPFHGELEALWRHPRLLLAQTCGYPLVTRLHGAVRLVGRPCFQLPDAESGQHCSLLLVKADDPRQSLAALHGCRGVINAYDSNTGMNLLRHSVAPYRRDGWFFRRMAVSGSHRASLRQIAQGEADLAAVDSVTFAYLKHHDPAQVAGVRVIARSVQSPTLPYITRVDGPDPGELRDALNQALAALPAVAEVLAITAVLATELDDYQALRGYDTGPL